MAYTGGELNVLNGSYGISAPHNSVPVMSLIKKHKPKSKEELYNLINYHSIHDCECGIKSKGSIEDFGKKLFNAQLKKWGFHKYSLHECIQWEYDLFVVQSLKGSNIEKKAMSKLSENICFCVKEAEGFVDEELRVDIIVLNGEIEIAGIQVKPYTYNFMREGIKTFNKISNKKWGKPVLYLFYDDNEEFKNLKEVIREINNISIDEK